ncbi:flagellar hook capping FlgD N-terminal domain-containing protein [Paenibacillus koleovorans]|uniref:flagellar hook capping FlgD N-terminal domain-containing protein n=1 Tax=Paenibacillus koleovorans TaxID=121608 RepID=UPI000FD71754|nr:flagellar hook capping FlgD N-terminal domain-containing protein [Paenibacillus koleovorans]
MAQKVGVMNGTYYYNNTTTRKTGSSEMGRDEFMKILITQMSNQDPTKPLEDKEFIAQMAQFTSVEQLANMATEMKLMRQSAGWASSLIGKSISWALINPDTQESVIQSGVVEAISIKEGQQYVNVNGQDVPMGQISKIWEE